MLNVITPNLSSQEDISLKENEKLSLKRAEELEGQYEREALPEGFDFENNNLMYQPEWKGDKEEPPSPLFICSELKVTACTRDKDNDNHGRLLEFKDIDGHLHTWAMPMELLAGDGTEYRKELLSKGLSIASGTKARQLLTFYIQQSRPLRRVRCVTQVGWHNGDFVFPNETIGASTQERVILQTTSCNLQNYSVSGTLQEWKDKVAAYCQNNSRLAFAVSAAFAPPLLDLLGHENGGFHYRGTSSTGKTTALNVASSVWGGKDFSQRWRATSNGVEAIAAWYNDAFLPLDEIAQIDPAQVGEVAYMLANGTGKARADRLGYTRKRQAWRLLFFSTGEINLAEHMLQAGKKVRAGQEVRIIDIPADTGKYGLFEDLHGFSSGASFANALSDNAQRYHGTPARAFINYLVVEKTKALELIKNIQQKFINTKTPHKATGQIQRIASRFGLVAAAGELATSLGLTGWEHGEAIEAASCCFDAMLYSRGGLAAYEEKQALAQVRRFFEQHGESRFTNWNSAEESKTINRAGFKKQDVYGVEFFVFPESFKNDICEGLDPGFVEKVLIEKQWIKPESKTRATRNERLPGYSKNKRCYRFTEKVLESGDDPVEEQLILM